jgi:HSP20 family protein
MARSRFRSPFAASRVPTRWGDPFVDLQRGVNRLFDDVFHGIGIAPSDENGSSMVAPRIDIDESDQAIQVSAELPGVPKDAVDVSIDGDVLVIRGEKHCERKDEEARVSECYYGTFQRAIQLPFSPDPDKVEATCENGVLKLIVPKPEQTPKSHKISVRVGEGKNGREKAQQSSSQGSSSAGSQNLGA